MSGEEVTTALDNDLWDLEIDEACSDRLCQLPSVITIRP